MKWEEEDREDLIMKKKGQADPIEKQIHSVFLQTHRQTRGSWVREEQRLEGEMEGEASRMDLAQLWDEIG